MQKRRFECVAVTMGLSHPSQFDRVTPSLLAQSLLQNTFDSLVLPSTYSTVSSQSGLLQTRVLRAVRIAELAQAVEQKILPRTSRFGRLQGL